MGLLRRILQSYSQRADDWFRKHQGASVVEQYQTDDGRWRITYEDQRTGERMVVETDEVGNMRGVRA